jgi:transposase-like protein
MISKYSKEKNGIKCKRKSLTKQKLTMEEKTAIVLEVFKGRVPVTEICQRHQVSITDVYHWCDLFLQGAKKAFDDGMDEKPITPEEI